MAKGFKFKAWVCLGKWQGWIWKSLQSFPGGGLNFPNAFELINVHEAPIKKHWKSKIPTPFHLFVFRINFPSDTDIEEEEVVGIKDCQKDLEVSYHSYIYMLFRGSHLCTFSSCHWSVKSKPLNTQQCSHITFFFLFLFVLVFFTQSSLMFSIRWVSVWFQIFQFMNIIDSSYLIHIHTSSIYLMKKIKVPFQLLDNLLYGGLVAFNQIVFYMIYFLFSYFLEKKKQRNLGKSTRMGPKTID